MVPDAPLTAAGLADRLDGVLAVAEFTDAAINGLQVEASADAPLDRVACAVDASLTAVRQAAGKGCQALLVHHGLLWGSKLRPLTGRLGSVSFTQS